MPDFLIDLFNFVRENIALGVQAGMVRSSIDCKAGLNALKEKYPMVAQLNTPEAVLKEWYTRLYLKSPYLAKLELGVNSTWQKQHDGQTVKEAIREALVKGIGEPILKLIHFLEFEHSRHCLPDNLASGLANLPVDFVYTDGVAGNKTTKILPGSRQKLNGTETYSMILSYFTTTEITPEEIYKQGKNQLNSLMPQVKLIQY